MVCQSPMFSVSSSSGTPRHKLALDEAAWAWKQTRGSGAAEMSTDLFSILLAHWKKPLMVTVFSNSDWWHVLVWPTFSFLNSERQSSLPSSMARKVDRLAVGIVFLQLLEEKKENTNIYSSSSALPLLTSLSVCYSFSDTTLSFSRIVPREMWPLFLSALFLFWFSFHPSCGLVIYIPNKQCFIVFHTSLIDLMSCSKSKQTFVSWQ